MKTKTTHTPGPWKVGEASRRKNGQTITRVAIQTDDGHYITDNVMASSFSAGEHESNARLIAAAPELLAALKKIVEFSDDGSNQAIIARAAIAKAEGR